MIDCEDVSTGEFSLHLRVYVLLYGAIVMRV